MVFSCVILIVFSGYLSNILYRSGMSNAHEVIKQRNLAVNFFIDGFFSEINNSIEILSEDVGVQNLPWLDHAGRERVIKLFETYTKANNNITYIFSGYENKELLINNYIPPHGYDPTLRPWYQAAMAVKPKISTGLPYQDINSKEWLFATSKALLSQKYGYTGVVSSDSSIQMVVDMLNQRGDVYKSSYSFVAKLDGEIILHHDERYLKRNISEVAGSSLSVNENGGSTVYTLGGKDKIAYYSRSRETDWLIFTVVDKDEITTSIARQILFSILLTGLIAVLLGLGQSMLLSRRFSTPLLQLREKVKSIIRGEKNSDSKYRYPENEIGMIAREVEQLAAHEIHDRSRLLEEANRLLEEKNSELQRLYVTDWLTGLYNRHKIHAELEKEVHRSERYQKAFSVILFDVDWFKNINDTYGHQAGDSVLQELSILLRNNLRATEILGRWGGEEFVLICPEIGLEGAKMLGIRICSLVENHHFSVQKQITISAGIAEFTGKEKISELMSRADDCLYAAKRNGRNRVVSVCSQSNEFPAQDGFS